MTFTGGNGDVDRHNVAMEVGGDPETWHHVAGVTDSETSEQILYVDGEEVARKSEQPYKTVVTQCVSETTLMREP